MNVNVSEFNNVTMNVKVDGFKFNYVRIIILGLETSLMTYKVHVQNP